MPKQNWFPTPFTRPRRSTSTIERLIKGHAGRTRAEAGEGRRCRTALGKGSGGEWHERSARVTAVVSKQSGVVCFCTEVSVWRLERQGKVAGRLTLWLNLMCHSRNKRVETCLVYLSFPNFHTLLLKHHLSLKCCMFEFQFVDDPVYPFIEDQKYNSSYSIKSHSD